MSLKILIFPFFSLLTLFLIIGFLKPDLDIIIEKMDTIDNQKILVEDSDSIVKHIDQLTSVVNENAESKKMLFTYLPPVFDHESIIDSFNFLATDSSLYVNTITLKQDSAVVMNNLVDANASSTDLNKSKVSIIPFSGEFTGSYQDIKTFLSQLNYTNRFQNINSFSLESQQKSGETEPSNIIKGIINIDYGYLKDFSVDSAVKVPFLRDRVSFDLSPITTFKDKMTEIPLPVVTIPGKENPFK